MASSLIFTKKKKNLPLAYKQAVILVELTPKENDIYDFIFDYLKGKDKYEKIIPLMLKGLQANPKEVALREYLVSAYLKTGKDDEAGEADGRDTECEAKRDRSVAYGYV